MLRRCQVLVVEEQHEVLVQQILDLLHEAFGGVAQVDPAHLGADVDRQLADGDGHTVLLSTSDSRH